MTAYAPRMSASPALAPDITNDTETVVAHVQVGGASNVNNQLLVHAMILLEAGTDTTGVNFKLYVGADASGTLVGEVDTGDTDSAGNTIAYGVDFLVDLEDQQPPEQYTLTATCVGASAAGGVGGGVISATVF